MDTISAHLKQNFLNSSPYSTTLNTCVITENMFKIFKCCSINVNMCKAFLFLYKGPSQYIKKQSYSLGIPIVRIRRYDGRLIFIIGNFIAGITLYRNRVQLDVRAPH